MSMLLLLAAAAAAADQAPICTDRPTKANAVCTVPAGAWQLESSSADWTRISQSGSEAKLLAIGASVVKLGLSERSDLQLAFTPLVRVSSGGAHESGFGDLVARYKHRLTRAAAPVQIAVIPYVKVPTARTGIGNGKAEAGLAAPVSVGLGAATLTFGPQADWLADGHGHGRHLAIVQLVNVAATLAPRLTLAGELWANWNFDPDGTVRQASADVAAAYAVTDRLQIDAGANLGLSRDTPDVQLYAGASIRF